jgi:hypothetical protein
VRERHWTADQREDLWDGDPGGLESERQACPVISVAVVLDARRARVQHAAEDATAELARDDGLRQGHAGAIAAGEQAWTTLTTRLRTRLVDTIDRGELLPVWFDTVLGMPPPPEADAWLQAGTELLANRTTYGVSDSVVALGPVPNADASRRRRD